ncbi:MAG: T9SS type A sorting domain-containing protein [Bacteroidetes bacterium]|nr:T9SS type A sorting domain-containing protein [Bacteroidota bacterium]
MRHIIQPFNKKNSILIIGIFFFHSLLFAQTSNQSSIVPTPYLQGENSDLYGINKHFIENIGQFGEYHKDHPEMGKILYAYEGFGIPVLFTEKGIIYLHRKLAGPTLTEIEIEEHANKQKGKKSKKKEEELEELDIIDKAITLTWVDANSNVEILVDQSASHYHTYGLSEGKAKAFTKITYKNLYQGIDLVYNFIEGKSEGYEYSLLVKPNADLQKVKILVGGDIKKLRIDNNGNLVLKSSAGKTIESIPVSYYGDEISATAKTMSPLLSSFEISKNIVRFKLPSTYDKTRGIIIDPFVSGTSNLTGTGVNAGIAKDVDYDYAGNVYVTGGGNGSSYKLAKYDPTGTLLWTFSGSMTIPAWTFGTYYGGWVVDKNTGHIYLGQGFAPSGGHRVIRINTTGVYDNYISTANGSFLENWKMYWSCNGGTGQLLIAGGGTNSNINFGIITPPATTISSINVTGIAYGTGGWAQDISDVIIDPATNSLYTIYGSLYGTPYLSNKIYKNNTPYSGASVAWNVPSGFTTIQEIANRPYLVGPEIDNSSNVFAINSSYLFYWDGKNLKAINKASGAAVGTPLTIGTNVALMSGGIIADECNNIFVGFPNGTIKVYFFNGSTFDDASKPDILIPGFSTSAVYDLAYYETQKILYASGKGFVGSFDLTSYGCSSASFTLNVTSSCGTLSATSTLTPTPPVGATVTYVLYNGLTQITSNTNGIFTGLNPNINYTIRATINQACSGIVTTTNFTLPGPLIVPTVANTNCGSSNGSITIVASGGATPYTYSKDGVTFQASNSFTALSAGLYTITVKDANNCSNTLAINIINIDGPTVAFTKTDAICGSSTGSITAIGGGGVAPLTYSINGSTFQTGNLFPGVAAGNYTLTIKDATGCINVASVVIANSPGPTATAIPAATFCNSNNGSITVVASGGAAPLQYSLNASTYQSGNIFTGLLAGAYTVTIQDANGCLSTASTTIANSAGPTLTVTSVTASCNNANGSITANSTGGVPPLLYSINGTTYQAANMFTGLVAGSYTVYVKDANNCITTAASNITSTGGPTVTGSTAPSSCASNTGTITAAGSGGTGALQYSINGINFQASTLFTGLAPNSYTLYVRDVAGCMGANIVVVTALAGPIISTTTTPAGCNQTNGVITATGSSGTIPYTYSIDNGITYQAGNTFAGLGVGSYSVIIKDANGCTATSNTTINNVSGLSINVANTSSACFASNGSISVTGNGGIAPLQYSINGSIYQASGVFTGLAGGTYTVYVKDANACIVTATTTITISQGPTITATVLDASCGANNGAIIATGTGGSAPLQYSINGSTYQASKYFINLAPGTYTVYVKNGINCISTTTVTITNIAAGTAINTFTIRFDDAYPCNTSLGKITNPKVNGATCGGCTYSLNFGPFVPNQTQLFLNLNPGTYYVTAKNAAGCTYTIMGTIGIGVNSTATAVVTGTTCNGTTGAIQLTGVGPKTPYHASITGMGGPWITFDPTYTFTGLAPGTYTLLMADDESFDIGPPIIPGGCITTQTIIVPSTNGPSIAASQTSGSCGLSNGTISAVGSGGTGLLNYSIDGGAFQPSSVFTGLAAGAHTVTVKDASGCTNSIIVNVTNTGAPIATAVSTASACGNGNGTITVNASGVTAPLQYSINGTVFQSSNVFTGLAPGSYTVKTADAGACITNTTVSVLAVPAPTVTAFTISASCNNSNGAIIANGASGVAPYQYSINGTTYQSSNQFTGLTAGFYTITIKDVNGCLNTTGISVGNLLAPVQTLAFTPATCLNSNGTITSTVTGGSSPYQYSLNGTTYQASNIFTSLAAGHYTIYAKDNNGCIHTKSILVTAPNVPQTLSATITNSSCGNSNGIILAAATGGIAPLQYSINGTTFQASTSFNLLAAGNYTLTVRDANLCTRTTNATVINLAAPTITSTSTLSSCFANDGTITAVGNGGTGALQYSKNGVVYQNSPVFTGLAPGPYTITIKDTKNCTNTTNVTVGKVLGPAISVTSTQSICGDTIIVAQTGGFPGFQYNLNLDPYQPSNKFPCKPPGTYLVRIIDANGCKDSGTFVVLGNSLPIELISFNGVAMNNYNLLEWSTSSEINNDYFTIEKSLSGTQFENIGIVDGAGNSTILKQYQFKDLLPGKELNYYRLKQTDFNGSYTYSNIIAIQPNKKSGIGYTYNGSDQQLMVFCYECNNENYNIDITDATGRFIHHSDFTGNNVIINADQFAKGYYFIRISGNENKVTSKVLIY